MSSQLSQQDGIDQDGRNEKEKKIKRKGRKGGGVNGQTFGSNQTLRNTRIPSSIIQRCGCGVVQFLCPLLSTETQAKGETMIELVGSHLVRTRNGFIWRTVLAFIHSIPLDVIDQRSADQRLHR